MNNLLNNFKLNYQNLLLKVTNYINKQFICYRIFKYDPTIDIQPRIDVYYYGLHEHYIMLLDTLIAIKDYNDESLSFRRSCREGICGSCAMNINGVNKLACIYRIAEHVSDYNTYINIYPLPHMSIIKDLIVDMKHFYNQYKSINPFLIQRYNLISFSYLIFLHDLSFHKTDRYITFNKISNAYHSSRSITIIVHSCSKENKQFKQDRRLLDGLYECILCACCTTSCPSYWWNSDKYLGPAVLLQAYRWIIDSRDNDLINRLNYLDDDYRLNRCHLILNCIRCCPKKLSPATAIMNMKYLRDHLKNNLH
jgi:succinate dehydrogenase / fumarate reductase iron-sulfur subunit